MLEGSSRASRRAVAFGALVSVAGGAAACAAIAGINPPTPREEAGDGSVSEDAAALEDALATGDTSMPPPDDGGGGSDAQVTEDAPISPACEMRTADDGAGVFVAPNGLDTLACGTRQSPCLTLQGALGQATTLGKSAIYVAAGTYPEALSLPAGLALEGAWGTDAGTWFPLCDPNAPGSVIQEPDDASAAVLVDSINGSLSLGYLQIRSKPASAVGAGESVYGIFARGATTTLTLDHVAIAVAAGGNGGKGGAGATGTSATSTGCEPSDAATGAAGDAGAPSGGGTFSAGGFAPGSGATGVTGATGVAGSPAGAGACSAPSCGSCTPGNCFLAPENAPVCGTNGQTGCGGGGGGGGVGGGGGGSSIALYVWAASVNAQNCSFSAGLGGAGAGGGAGSNGGASSAGVAGESRQCISACGNQCTDAGCPVCIGSGPTESGGTAGGAGGQGGTGGNGGAGAGGWSCGTFTGGSGSVTGMGFAFAVSDAGMGGLPSGAPGTSATQCSSP